MPDESEDRMMKAHYEVVEHDGGWAYRMDGTFSETFPSQAAAEAAALRAAAEQRAPGEPEEIEFEDKDGRWHTEHSAGLDRPETEVT